MSIVYLFVLPLHCLLATPTIICSLQSAMKRSSSASMITELLQMSAPLSNSDSSKHHNNRENGSGLFGKRNLSASNTSLPSDIPIGLSWASPIRRQVSRYFQSGPPFRKLALDIILGSCSLPCVVNYLSCF